jgi:predicted double-glycine peptidase
MISVICLTSVWPFLAPAFNQKQLAGLITRIDGNGVCLQSTDYTCGPASAVTALQQLGIKAQEGELALLAHTTSATGTPPDILAMALNSHYAAQGLICEYRNFANLKELAAAGLTLAVVKFNIVTDHYVTVLEVNDREVIVGDPLSGIEKLSHDDFKNKWRFSGVVLKLR